MHHVIKRLPLFPLLAIYSLALPAQPQPAIFDQLVLAYRGPVKNILVETFRPVHIPDSGLVFRYDDIPAIPLHFKLYVDQTAKIVRLDEMKKQRGIEALYVERYYKCHYTGHRLDSLILYDDQGKIGYSDLHEIYHYTNDSAWYMITHNGGQLRRYLQTQGRTSQWLLESDSSSNSRWVMHYDHFSRKVLYEKYYRDQLIQSIHYTYHPMLFSEHPCQVIRYSPKEKDLDFQYFIRNPMQDIVSSESIYTEASLKTKYRYRYDEQGNWIERWRLRPDGEVTSLVKRTFVYW